MSVTRNFLAGIGTGAGLMYLLDPDRGRRRRALLRDKFSSGVIQSGHGMQKTWRDASNRAYGVVAAARSLRHRGDGAPDDVLEARVRSRLGRAAAHPHAIQVRLNNGHVVLEGPVLEQEVARVLAQVRAVPGVRSVEDRMAQYRDAADIPSLQGHTRPNEGRRETVQTAWTPTYRAMATLAGSYLLFRGLRRGGVFGTMSSMAGVGLLTRAAANMDFKHLVGAGEPVTVDVQKTINILAPVQEVYAFWKNYRNFPRFMTHLKEVRDLGNGRSHWIATSLGGVPVAWDAELTQDVENKLLAWRSVPGSRIENEGSVRFDENPDGTTRVTVRMCYAPPAGMVGHVVASMFRRDPKHEMEDDLVRLKSLLEHGKTRAHGETVRREELSAPRRSYTA